MELQRLQALESRNPGVLFGSQALSGSTFLGPGLSQKCAHSLFLLPFLTSLPPSLCFCWSTTCSQHFHLTNSVFDICQTDLICWSSSASSAASQSCISETGILDNILAVEMSWPRRAHSKASSLTWSSRQFGSAAAQVGLCLGCWGPQSVWREKPVTPSNPWGQHHLTASQSFTTVRRRSAQLRDFPRCYHLADTYRRNWRKTFQP